jgi:hypothetical protein
MQERFRHPEFRTYRFEDVPLNRDVFLIDECWLPEYEDARIELFNGGDWRPVGYISYAAVRGVSPESLEISWYPNIYDRFHEVWVRLPRAAFITCVKTPRWDEKPHIFVKGTWLSALHHRPYSAFALVDAIGVKVALSKGQLAGSTLVRLRDRIDTIAAANPRVAFVSFADSLLLKVNWFAGQYRSETGYSDVSYSYAPESLITLMPTIAQAFKDEVGLGIYAAISQGVNEYEDTALLHRSKEGNHVSLNSLGLPFAQLLAIDGAVRKAIGEGQHSPAELYLDEQFYHSLRFMYGFDKDQLPQASYRAPLVSSLSQYVYTDCETILRNLDPSPPDRPRKTK